MSTATKCPRCGRVLPVAAMEGLCPQCVIRVSFGESSRDTDSGFDEIAVGTRAGLVKIRYFGDYELLEEIARGGMGTVFKARQVSLNRLVALKLISAGVLASEEVVKRFKAEAEAAAALDHPNIVPIHEIGVHAEQQYFSMAFINGPNLSRSLRDSRQSKSVVPPDGENRPPDGAGRYRPRDAARLIVTVSRAVHYAHERGLLHRDLKPGNILLDPQGEPHLTDFGLAKFLQKESTLTHTNAVLGTPAYMSPEQARGEPKAITTASDVYGLGAVLYETLTGVPPFAGGTSLETIRQVLDEDPRRPSVFNPEVDLDLETICLKCLEKEPPRRYASALLVAEELERWLRREPILARPATMLEKGAKWARRKPAVAALVLALHVALAAGLAGIVWQWLRAERHAANEARERLRVEQHLYASDVGLASEELADHNLIAGRERLQRIALSPQQRQMRGFEWRYLVGQSRGDQSAILGRHDSWIGALAVSPDDQWAASISADGMVKLWDLAMRKEAAVWKAHAIPAEHRPGWFTHALAFSPHGELLAAGGADGRVCLWDVHSHQQVSALKAFTESCSGIAFSADGRVLAALSGGSACLLTLSNSTVMVSAKWQTGLISQDPIFLPDARTLLIAGYQNTVALWDVSAADTIHIIQAFDGSAAPAAISPDTRWLAAGVSGQHMLKKWNLQTGQEEKSWQGRTSGFVRLAISRDNQVLAAGLGDGTIMLWDMAEAREPKTLAGHEDTITGLAFSEHRNVLVSASLDKTVRLWDGSMTNSQASDRSLLHGFSVVAVSFSPDSRYLASVAREHMTGERDSGKEAHTLKLWEMSTQTEIGHAQVGGQALGADGAFSPDGRFFAGDDFAGTLRLYSVPALELTSDLKGHLAKFLPDGHSMIYASWNRLLRRDYQVGNGTSEVLIGEEPGYVIALAVSPNGSLAAATSEKDDGVSIRLWDVESRKSAGAPLVGHSGWVPRLAFSPDGKTLASASWDHTVGLWDIGQRRNLALLRGHSDEVRGVAFSADGRTVASCGEDAVRLWNLATLRQVALLKTGAALECVAFSPDGQWLAGAANDGTVRLWRAPSFEAIAAENNSFGLTATE